MERAKLLIEVMAGVIPGEPAAEFTRRWGWTAADQEALVNEEPAARDKWIQIHGESREYAASLEDPRRVNWVRRDWVWL